MDVRCKGCGNDIMNCHDVLFGAYCVNKVISYAKYCDPFSVDDLVIKKIFIESYNQALSFESFRTKGESLNEGNWLFPPRCMQDNSYNYSIFWYQSELLGIKHEE